jgi:hypothetical protein
MRPHAIHTSPRNRGSQHILAKQHFLLDYYITPNRNMIVHVSFARVRTNLRPCGIYGGQSGTGAGILRVLLFPLPILIPQTSPHSSIIRGSYNSPSKWLAYQVDSAVNMKIVVFWDVTQCSLVAIYQIFEEHITSMVKVEGFKV